MATKKKTAAKKTAKKKTPTKKTATRKTATRKTATRKTATKKTAKKKTTGTQRTARRVQPKGKKRTTAVKRSTGAMQVRARLRSPGAAALPAADSSEEDLLRLRDAMKSIFEKLREVDDEALPESRKEEYWRNRHIARTAWELAENTAFANLVEQQTAQLPAVSASSAKLAKDVQRTATSIGVLNAVSSALGILGSVIALLA